MIPTYAEQPKYTVYLRKFLKNHVWKDGMAILHDAPSDGTSLPFVEMCWQLCVGHTTRHSIKKLEKDIKNGDNKWPAVCAKRLFNIWRMEIHAHKGSAIHSPPGGTGVAWFPSEKAYLTAWRLARRKGEATTTKSP